MKELVSESGANLVVASLSILLIVLASIIGAKRGKVKAGILVGVGFGALTLGLWWMYNAIVCAAGLDSVWALVGQTAIFVAVGAAIGVISARYSRGKC